MQVRARPLSETNPELSKYMEAVSGPGAATGVAIASLGRRGRGDVDADSMGYDEVRFWLEILECAPIVQF